jgi:hypothetical protein
MSIFWSHEAAAKDDSQGDIDPGIVRYCGCCSPDPRVQRRQWWQVVGIRPAVSQREISIASRKPRRASGVVVGTGTVATAWLKSMAGGRREVPDPPALESPPGSGSFARLAWPSRLQLVG